MFGTEVIGSYRSIDQINSAMLRVYNHMTIAVLVSALVAGLVAGSEAAMAFFFTGFMQWVTLFLPVLAIFPITIALNAEPPRVIAAAMLYGFLAALVTLLNALGIDLNVGGTDLHTIANGWSATISIVYAAYRSATNPNTGLKAQ